ncbi:DUF1775 domain-containing protein [Micromonospora sp. NPDC000207]|uniref:DUF1775 domain-containing protein n=1 Tax=Micromonospora sp. NPDC000207 TaxID=3154246 RepID=UPI003327E228
MSTVRWLRAVGAAAAGVLACLVVGAGPAAAHVEVTGAQPNGDGSATLTFAFDHSCDGSPTTELVVALPEGVTATDTVAPSGWSGSVTGNRVTFVGPGLETAEVGVTARLVGRPGDTLQFPVLQRCADGGSYDWIDLTGDSDHPAPRLVATAAVLAAAAEPEGVSAADGASPGQGDGASLGQALSVLAGFVLLAAGGGFVLTRHRLRRAP